MIATFCIGLILGFYLHERFCRHKNLFNWLKQNKGASLICNPQGFYTITKPFNFIPFAYFAQGKDYYEFHIEKNNYKASPEEAIEDAMDEGEL